MAKLPSFEEVKEGIRQKIAAENIAKQSNGDTQRLKNAMAIVPETEMWQMVIDIHENVLPAAAKKHGENSEQVKYYSRIRDAVIWSLYTGSRYERELYDAANNKMLVEFYRERCAFLERELLKYTTTEQLMEKGAVDAYRQSIVTRALNLIDKKENKTT